MRLEDDTPRDGGFSIIEVLVAMLLFGMVTSAVVAVAAIGMRTTTGLGIRLDNANQGQAGIAATSKVLRTAVLPDQLESQVCDTCADTAIISASGTKVTFYANLNNTGQGPSLVTLQVIADPRATNGTGLLEQRTQPPTSLGDGRYTFCNPATVGCVVNSRVLARGVVMPSSTAFAYYDFGGMQIAGATVAAADLPRVSSVDVQLTVQSQPGSGYPTSTMVQRIRLPNADINVLVQPS